MSFLFKKMYFLLIQIPPLMYKGGGLGTLCNYNQSSADKIPVNIGNNNMISKWRDNEIIREKINALCLDE